MPAGTSSLVQASISEPADFIDLPEPAASQRFTVDGSLELEAHLQHLCDEARRAVQNTIPPARLEGMLLGGGYGRGEGGVLRTPQGDEPYNDLEFYVFIKGLTPLTARRFQPLLDQRGMVLSEEAGLEIELRATSVRTLRRRPPSMFYYDLVMAHRRILGPENLLSGCEHHRHAERILLSGAMRLLMNRCSGLLFARERLLRNPFSAEDADFVGRNIAKAKLALGDVLLTVLGQYHWSCRERNRRLLAVTVDLPWLAELKAIHSEGVEFKLHPHRSNLPAAALAETHARISALGLQIWLWLEARRLGRKFETAEQYAFSTINKCPETPAAKNALINLATFGRRVGLGKLFVYPRQRLLNSLPLLLWSDGLTDKAPSIRRVQEELLTTATWFPELVASYQNLWRRFN